MSFNVHNNALFCSLNQKTRIYPDRVVAGCIILVWSVSLSLLCLLAEGGLKCLVLLGTPGLSAKHPQYHTDTHMPPQKKNNKKTCTHPAVHAHIRKPLAMEKCGPCKILSFYKHQWLVRHSTWQCNSITAVSTEVKSLELPKTNSTSQDNTAFIIIIIIKIITVVSTIAITTTTTIIIIIIITITSIALCH